MHQQIKQRQLYTLVKSLRYKKCLHTQHLLTFMRKKLLRLKEGTRLIRPISEKFKDNMTSPIIQRGQDVTAILFSNWLRLDENFEIRRIINPGYRDFKTIYFFLEYSPFSEVSLVMSSVLLSTFTASCNACFKLVSPSLYSCFNMDTAFYNRNKQAF